MPDETGALEEQSLGLAGSAAGAPASAPPPLDSVEIGLRQAIAAEQRVESGTISAERQATHRRKLLWSAASFAVVAVAILVTWNLRGRLETRATDAIRLRQIADQKELAAIPDSVDGLQRYVDKCRREDCLALDEANRRLASAQAAEAARARREQEASRSRLAAVQAAEVARAEADRKDLDGAGSDPAALQSFVNRCRASSCSLLQEASDRLAAAQAAQARVRAETRLSQATFNVIANYDIKGGDFTDGSGSVRVAKMSSAECLTACRANGVCVAFSYDKWNGVCFLKKSLNALRLDPHSDTSIRSDQTHPGFASDTKHFCPYNNNTLTGDISQRFRGQSTSDCEQACQSDNTCVAYTFSRDDKSCSLFRSVSNRQSNAENVVAGIRQQDLCH
jgi:hypothetical protein